MAAVNEIGDSALWYLLIGVGLGMLVGLTVGITVYVFVNHRGDEERPNILNLETRQDRQ